MNQVNLLRDKLRPHLGWHGARLSFLAAFLIALLRVKTVNFSELATAFTGKALQDSHYKRLQRFFRNFEMDYCAILRDPLLVGIAHRLQIKAKLQEATDYEIGAKEKTQEG